MTKDELKKEAEEKYKEHLADANYYESSEEESYLTGYQDGAEPREKIIAELKELLEACKQERTEALYRNDQYIKENEELKKRVEVTEIIKQLLLIPYANNEEVYADITSILAEAENFLKEVEK